MTSVSFSLLGKTAASLSFIFFFLFFSPHLNYGDPWWSMEDTEQHHSPLCQRVFCATTLQQIFSEQRHHKSGPLHTKERLVHVHRRAGAKPNAWQGWQIPQCASGKRTLCLSW